MVSEDLVEQKVLEQIESRRREIAKLLQDIVRIPSVSGKERRVQEFIASELGEMGLNLDVWEPDLEELRAHKAAQFGGYEMGYKDRPNVVGTLRGSGGGKSIILNGHCDVIAVDRPSAWKHDPWGGEIEDGKLYGRGTADMKGGLAGAISAVRAIVDSGVKLKGNVILESVVDEEPGGNGTLACTLRGYRADAAIVAEPSEMMICPGHRGGAWFRITVTGKPMHTGEKDKGVSAIEKGLKIFDALAEFERIRLETTKRHPLLEKAGNPVPVLCGIFEAGHNPSTVAGKAVLQGCIGFLPGETIEGIKRDLEDFVNRTSQLDSWLMDHTPTVEFHGIRNEPYEIPVDHPLVNTASQSFEKALKKEAEVGLHRVSSDGRLLAIYGEMPTLIFGPGSVAQCHTIDEFISLDQVVDYTKAIALTICNWCGC